MPTPFTQTSRAMQADSPRAWALPGTAGAALAGLLLWGMLIPIPAQIWAEDARIDAAAAPVQPLIDGRIARVLVALGQPVREGEVVIELAAEEIWLAFEEAQARRDSAEERFKMMSEREAGLSEALEARQGGARRDQAEAEARRRAAEAEARYARERADGSARLAEAGGVARQQAAAEAAEAARLEAWARAEAEAAQGAGRRAEEIARLSEQERATFREDLAKIQGEFAALEVQVARLEEEIERYRLRAPADGRVGYLSASAPGVAVRAGEVLAVVVPEEPDRVLARFPASAQGRIEAGQAARIRLLARPDAWLPLTVAAVGAPTGAEPWMQVSLSLPEAGAMTLLQAGMPGEVVVEVERASAARQLLRAAGLAPAGGL